MSADGMAPIAYACVFYGAAFLVAAAAVLALQQLSQAADAHAAYRALHRLGAPRRLAAGSLRRQVGVSFAAPFAMACAHCVFGFVLIGALALMAESAGFVPIVAGTVGATAAVFALLLSAYLPRVRARSCAVGACGGWPAPSDGGLVLGGWLVPGGGAGAGRWVDAGRCVNSSTCWFTSAFIAGFIAAGFARSWRQNPAQ